MRPHRLAILLLGLAAVALGVGSATWVRADGDGPTAHGGPGAERETWREREVELLARIGELERSLARERERRTAREVEWLEFTRAISALEVPQTPSPPDFLEIPQESSPPGPSAGELAARERAAARSARVLADLRAFLLAEQVLALDVLEVGSVNGGWTGPVVVRLVDDLGRPSGTLVAERLRLEVSRAGRSVTLILEEGYESHGGVAVPFGPPSEPGSRRGGVRRIELPGMDPLPWIEAFPELVGEATAAVPDDGLWNLVELRMRLDGLLRDDTSGGHWRLRSLGGVTGTTLHDVQLVELDDRARVVRRLFADRMQLLARGRGVELRLEDGVQMRGDARAPFLDGRYRVFLPRARAAAWGSLPGLRTPPGEPAGESGR